MSVERTQTLTCAPAEIIFIIPCTFERKLNALSLFKSSHVSRNKNGDVISSICISCTYFTFKKCCNPLCILVVPCIKVQPGAQLNHIKIH